jgi:membrane protease subunit HflK
MSWNNGGGPSPWGTPGNTPPRKPNRPDRGPWGGSQGVPDMDEMLERIQAGVRRILPGGGGPGGGRGGPRANGRLIGLIGLVALVAWLASGFYRVQPDQEGVVLRFGAFVGKTAPGLNYHIPWPVETALTPATTRINRIEVGFLGTPDSARSSSGAEPGREGGGRLPVSREVPQEALMLTGDENIIDINLSVFWRVRDAGAYLFNTRNADYTVKSAAESMMREVIGRTPIQPALTEARARIEEQVKAGTQAILDQYGAGVEVTQVQLQKVDPPTAVIESFRDVQRANTDAETARNEAESFRNDIVPRARGDAARLTAEADGARQANIAEAAGQAQRFLSVYTAYTAAKDVTLRRLYIETMQEILTKSPSIVIDDRLKGIVPYLPLDAARPPVPAQPAAGAPR